MASKDIHFHKTVNNFNLADRPKHKGWLNEIALSKGFTIKDLNIVFCNDEYLLEMNQSYLEHDTLTDIITFDLSEEDGKILGELYISVERVQDNAANLSIEVDKELARVMAHGVLHLCGHKDKEEEEIKAMRAAEEEALTKWNLVMSK